MRKYYDEDDDYEQEQDRSEIQVTLLPPERLRPLDGLIALLLGGAVFIGLCVFSYSGLAPEVWEDATVAAGLRPPTELFPGFWRVLARLCYLGGDAAGGNAALVWLGRVCAALTASGVYLLLRSLLALLVRGRLRYSVRRYFVQISAAVMGTLLFACADPVWRSGQAFSPSGLLVLITVLALLLWTGFLLHGGLLSAYASFFLLGALGAETPMGFVLLAVAFFVYFQGLRRGALCENMPLINPIVGPSAKWHLTFFWALGLLLGIAANCYSFVRMHGLEAAGLAVGDLPLSYLLGWWGMICNAASGLGWVLAVMVCGLPFVVATVMLPRAVDEEQFLPYHVGSVFFFTGLLAYSQVSMLSPLWFWSWTDAAQVDSSYLHQVFEFLSAGTVAFALVAFGGDCCCRNHTRLAMQRFAELNEGGDDASGGVAVAGLGKRGGLVVFGLALALLAAGVLPGRAMTRTREMLAIVDAYVQEVVSECGPVRWIFTDGFGDARLLDCRIELAAAEKGRRLHALAMMGGNPFSRRRIQSKTYRKHLCSRSGESALDAEDLLAFDTGDVPNVLLTWVREKPARLASCAVQLGFNFWKQALKALPPCSGVLSRPAGMEESDCRKGIEAATALADRIDAIYRTGGLDKAAGECYHDLFYHVQWRLARIASVRAERLGVTDAAAANRDKALAERLNETNARRRKMLESLEKSWKSEWKNETPRQGLLQALQNRKHAQARLYAEPILAVDPDNVEANFGMGMDYYERGQWAKAEQHLLRCLVKSPRNVFALNNLAMVCLRQEKFDEAEKWGRAALEIKPEAAEILNTLQQIREAVDRKKAQDEAAARKKAAAAEPAE